MSIFSLKHPSTALCALPPAPGRDAAHFLAASSSPKAGAELAVVAAEDDGRLEGFDVPFALGAAGKPGPHVPGQPTPTFPRDEIAALEAYGAEQNCWNAFVAFGSRTNGVRAALVRVPYAEGPGAEPLAHLPGIPERTVGIKLASEPVDRPSFLFAASWNPAGGAVTLFQTPAAGPKASFKATLAPSPDGPTSLACNPHSPHLFSVTVGSHLHLFDSRSASPSPTASIPCHRRATAHSYNPNLPHHIATGGQDGLVRVWDLRAAPECAKELRAASHWVTSVAYHPTHDQLLLAASTDAQVRLHGLGTASYAGQGSSGSSDDSEGSGRSEPRKRGADGLLASFDIFQDSVADVAWARGGGWAFAGCAWGEPGGRVGAGEVPRNVRLAVMLGE
ncbi:WD40-repeat-containing domain protein [Hyaloraphidium curvatum]|nr:WD40-repeat-containing domain protein [Hyaloraphidium curvatum]